jgi:hypothetical protein
MRLNPQLRTVLEQLLQTMRADAKAPACCIIPAGLFIPLHELQCRKIEPSTALRALSDASMLVADPHSNAKTVSIDIDGVATLGIVIARRCIVEPAAIDGELDAGA